MNALSPGTASKRWVAGFLCALLSFGSAFLTSGAYAQRKPMYIEETPAEDLPSSYNVNVTPEEFRDQLVRYLHDSEATMAQALAHPLIGPELHAAVGGQVFQIPIPAEVFEAIDALDYNELEELRSAFARSPAVLEAPAALSSAMAALDDGAIAAELSGGGFASATAGAFASNCGTNYAEWDNILSKRAAVTGLVRAQGGLELTGKIAEKIGDVLRAVLEDIPPIGSKIMIVFYVVWGVTHISQAALGIASSALDLKIAESQLCLDSCLADTADPSHPTLDSGVWRGKGCDNRDNDCDSVGIIDDASEDRFSPEVFVDSSVLLQCYGSQNDADAAARRAVTAEDDCKLDGGPMVTVTSQACSAMVSAQATDMGSPANVSPPRNFSLKVDGDAPVIAAPALSTCYATVANARTALNTTSVVDTCSDFSTMIRTSEKECVASLELEAVDECGNRAMVEETVRVDGSPPDVKIETLKIPSIDGLSCFATQADAVATVVEATQFSDNCTAMSDLSFTTSTSGNACNLTVTNTVGDDCSGVTTSPSSDSLLVRVDAAPPVLSCSVAQPVLWPADGQLVDIGFQLNASDNCDPQVDLDVTVTSDESTRFAYVTQSGNDPYPDAVVERTASGGIQRILLRAQRRDTNVASYDGRVYRIRVVATDACGLSSKTECWVTVPSTSNSTAVNSGQYYDATLEN